MSYISGLVDRIKPTRTTDGSYTAARMSRYGEIIVQPVSQGIYPIADEGSYFKAVPPSPGTGFVQGIISGFGATVGFVAISNSDAAGGKRIYLDYLTMICSSPPTTAGSMQFVVAVDSTIRYTSGGTPVTPSNANMDDATASIATLHVGNLVLAAESVNVRRLSRGVLKAAIPAVNDSYTLQFGAVDSSMGALSGTGVATVDQCGPVIIGPGQSALIHLWYPSSTVAATHEIDFGWWER